MVFIFSTTPVLSMVLTRLVAAFGSSLFGLQRNMLLPNCTNRYSEHCTINHGATLVCVAAWRHRSSSTTSVAAACAHRVFVSPGTRYIGSSGATALIIIRTLVLMGLPLLWVTTET